MKPQIFQVIDHTESGGAQLVVYNLIKLLKDTYNFSVIVLGKEGYYSYLYQSLNVPIYTFPKNNSKWNPLIFLQLIDLYRREQPDIVHTHLFKSNILGVIAASGNNYKTILHDHTGVYPQSIKNFPHYFSNKLFQEIYLILFRIALNQCDEVIVLTESMVQSYIQDYSINEDKIIVLPNFIDVKEFSRTDESRQLISIREALHLTQETKIVTMVGRLEPQKSWISFLEVAKQIQKIETTPCVFLVIGTGSEEQRLRDWIRTNRLKNIYFLGYRRDIANLLQQSDLFLLTSIQETFGIVILEAMAAGLPLVVSRTPGTEELVQEGVNGFTFSYGDVKNLTNIVLNLSINNGLIDKLGTNSRIKAQSFEWEFTAREYLKLLSYGYDNIEYEPVGTDIVN